MQYKDLIYKITSSSSTELTQNAMKVAEEDVNDAKKTVKLKDVLIGIMVGSDIKLDKSISGALKTNIERTLTVLFNSPISDTFAFLPFDKQTLLIMLELFPNKKHHFIATKDIFDEIKTMKTDKMNIGLVYETTNVKEDFVNKIDYLVTINIESLEPTMKSRLDARSVMILPMTFRSPNNLSQKEKLVVPDPTGWGYNAASGIWTKTWGNDGYAEIPSWYAPSNWGLDPNASPQKE